MMRHRAAMKMLRIASIVAALALCPFAHAATVMDETGRRVFVPDAPRRIVSLAPDISEILFALGLEKEIVGVSQFSDYPDAAKGKPKVGSYVSLSLERILSLSPDLVIGTTNGNRREAVNRLEQAGLNVYVVNPERFSDIYRTIINLGRITGRETAARQLADSMRKRAERIVSRTASCPRPKVFVQIDSHPLVTVGGSTIYSELIAMAGGHNIAARAPGKYPRYNLEALISKQPDVILLSPMVQRASRNGDLDFWSRWQSIPAVRNSRIHLVNADLTDRFSPRIVQGLEEIAGILHPERTGRQRPRECSGRRR
ncbi:ABC transporter substrate-binding protein [Syntrophus sp. (in: bacteria)]|uniref:ABC transporter substrate-binding protein n=1 Tax=Syntrophus sp. (in: bacteria) TaxID=48412 RepID=UPI00345E7EAC